MQIVAQSSDIAETTSHMTGGMASIIALGVSIAFTVLLWRLGAIRRLVNVQNERQKRFLGQRNLRGAEWGTGRSAAISFTGVIWFITFCLVFYGLILWA